MDIYNEYVVNSVATFETEPLRVEEMEGRIAGISASYPYLVYVDQDEVVGYCYAHTWKEKAAYKYTLETSHPTTHANPVYEIDDILHYCVANIPGAVPQTSTLALTNATLPYVIKLADRGWEKACEEDPGLELGLNIVEGKIVYPAVAEAFPSLKA